MVGGVSGGALGISEHHIHGALLAFGASSPVLPLTLVVGGLLPSPECTPHPASANPIPFSQEEVIPSVMGV